MMFGKIATVIRNIYLTMFLLLFKTTFGWSPEFNARMNAAIITLIEFFAILGIAGWIDVLFGTRVMANFPKWTIFLFFLILSVPNHYVLISRGWGLMFVHEFSHFTGLKKWSLLTVSATVMVAIVAFFFYTVSVHRRIFPSP